MTDVSIIIISYNTKARTLECLASIAANVTSDAEVIVVDNASSDGSADAIRKAFPAVRLMEPGQNLGFGRASNLAARDAAGASILLLNPDTVVLDDAVETLLRFASSHPEAGIVGGTTLYADRSLNNTCCFAQPSLWSLFCTGTGLASLFRGSTLFNPELIGGWRRDTVREVGVITGCFLLISRELWNELGGFDEDFFLYSEDTDLCLRALRAGRKCLHCPTATIIHHGGESEVTRSEKIIKVNAARALFMRKHWSAGAARFGELMLDLQAAGRYLAHSIRWRLFGREGNREMWRDVWRARAAWRGGRPRPQNEMAS